MKKFFCFVCVFLVGCTKYYVKPGYYMEEVAYEKQQCMKEAMEKTQGDWVFYEGPCMVAKGFSVSYFPAKAAGMSYSDIQKLKNNGNKK